MPEGPSILILKEQIARFNRKKVLQASGNAKIAVSRLDGKTIQRIQTWGKHLLLCFDGFFVRIHLLMFGSYLINDRKPRAPRLRLQFKKEELNFYTASIQLIEGNTDDVYDWKADVMNKGFDAKQALKKVKAFPDEMICDILMDQEIFSGVGNIIKNEILFITRIHPKSIIKNIPATRLKALIAEAVRYSFDFLQWKKANELKKHLLAYGKKICPRCKIPLHKEYPGKKKRRSFFCDNCQVLY